MIIKISDVYPSLTKRQGQVCVMVMSGMTNKEIARSLGISSRTIEDHKYDIYRAAEVKNVVELLRKAFGSPEVVA